MVQAARAGEEDVALAVVAEAAGEAAVASAVRHRSDSVQISGPVLATIHTIITIIAKESEATKPGFDLGGFLNNLGDRLGIDLAGAAENFGLDKDKFTASPSSDEVDFEPRTDIFDTPSHYEIHASLPGAKKEDVGVDWDGEHSILRVTGVVHRPGVDEELLKHLVVNGRKRENGLFEKAVRLGTKRDPASVDVAGITAKMVDGVLVIRVPKVDREVQRREVPISQAESTQPHNDEKDLLFDADEEMYEAAPQVAAEPTTRGKDHDARDERSVTAGREEETLPRYEVEEASASEKDMSDWERDSEEEGDYVKINVD
ncbi:uncharacterized protein AB675_5902 [Cyphellophora attinorum]|uniref:SHSP domain-containing protein n=1 Tax=Cyphellophora attinorum TaxID=1664694 RepID=A0A0N1NZN4_9EURO|nr:uncharacterized protein AB675_5902 [Phialophora attinorum]KPI38907.1 hypothetical protein AB675_5902 [Phialophora attinorum]